MLIDLALFLISTIVLVKSSTILVSTLTNIAILFKLSEFLVGFILMAFATSLPELFVGITSAIEGSPTLSLGNVIGANIADLTLVIGLAAVISRGVRVEKRTSERDIFYTFVAIIIPLILMIDGVLKRTDGLVLVTLYGFYLARLVSEKDLYSKPVNHMRGKINAFSNFFKFFIGASLLLASAHVIVQTTQKIAIQLNLPLVLIGISLIALGTTLPELSFEIPAMLKKQGGMAFGNILGSVVTNSTFILGVTSIINPIYIAHFDLFLFGALFTIFTIFLFSIFLKTEHKLSWKEGLILVILYVIFIMVEFTLKNGG